MDKIPNVIHAYPIDDRTPCPKCKSAKTWRHTPITVRRHHVPLFGQPTVLEIKCPRYKCAKCGNVFSVPLPAYVGDKRMTTPLEEILKRRVLERKLGDLAQDFGITVVTLSRMADRVIANFEKTIRFPLPSKMGLDEVRIDHKYRTTVTNLGNHTIIDFLPDRTSSFLIRYFTTHYTLEERQAVRWICCDMYWGFNKALASTFPNATWVIDRFHVLQQASFALEAVRKTIQENFPKATADLSLKKGLRWYLVRRFNNLTLDERAKFAVVRKVFPQLYQAYVLKEMFFDIYECGTRLEAEKAFENWVRCIPKNPLFDKFRDVANMVLDKRNYNTIFNYWDSNKLTNGFTECANALIRAIAREGRGFSFRTLRGRILYNPKALEVARMGDDLYGASYSNLTDIYQAQEHEDDEIPQDLEEVSRLDTNLATDNTPAIPCGNNTASLMSELATALCREKDYDEDVPF